MRDPARIERILGLVKEIWELYPDVRLTQLLINALPGRMSEASIYNFEDDQLELHLVDFRDRLRKGAMKVDA